MNDEKDAAPNLTRAQAKLLEASVIIYGESATKKDAAFIARELVQVSLPHRNPGALPIWTRSNGNLTLVQPRTSIVNDMRYR